MAKLLTLLFEITSLFEMTTRIELVMLQKTLLNIEGLGRQLDPELDLWATAKPFLEKWMREQVGFKGLLRTLRREAPYWATMLPQMPRLVHRALAGDRVERVERMLGELFVLQRRRNRMIGVAVALLALALVLAAASRFW